MNRLMKLLGQGEAPPRRMIDGFVDSLLQTFENCRPGLSEETIRAGGTEGFFADLYEKEVARLREQIRRTQTHLLPGERDELFRRVDERIRKVVLPAYARLTGMFTSRERNDFFLTAQPFHGAERLVSSALGLALGGFVVWAPFIPIWSKEWVVVFGVGGFVFPNLRRVFALRRYQVELNQLVTRTDDEIWRMDLELMTAAAGRDPSEPAAVVDSAPEASAEQLSARLADAERTPATPAAASERKREGDV